MNLLVKITYLLTFIYFSHAQNQLCLTNQRERGKCKFVEDCPNIRRPDGGIMTNLKVCFHSGGEKVFCCPDKAITVTSTLPPHINQPDTVVPPDKIRNVSSPKISLEHILCLTKQRQRGTCKFIEDCPQILNHESNNLKICFHSGRKKVFCCPDNVVTSTLPQHINQPTTVVPPTKIRDLSSTKSSFITSTLPPPVIQPDTVAPLAKIRDISNPGISFECGIRSYEGGLSNFIVGGTVAHNNSWPWMALLGNNRGNKIKWFCAAALIHPQWVFTAAHCFINLQRINDLVVRLGEHNYLSSGKESASVDYGAFEVLSHPQYKPGEGYHDTALIRLAQIVKFTEAILPVCLPWSTDIASENHVYEAGVVVGWGAEKFESPTSSVLRVGRITVFDSKYCHQSYSKLLDFGRTFPNGITNENLICAGNPGGGIAACRGDSGGPLVRGIEYPDKVLRYITIGVVSSGHGCGLREFPGLYAPVATSLDWIKRVAF